jgi:hypothetical protein
LCGLGATIDANLVQADESDILSPVFLKRAFLLEVVILQEELFHATRSKPNCLGKFDAHRCSGAAALNGSSAPLPAKIVAAKTVFVDNHPGLDQDRAQSEFFDEMHKWNRWRTVTNKADADLMVVMTVRQKQPISPTNPYIGTTEIAFVDPATNQLLWSITMPWSGRGAVRDLVNDLRHRIERQEKQK